MKAKTGRAPMELMEMEVARARVRKRSWLNRTAYKPEALAVSGSKEVKTNSL